MHRNDQPEDDHGPRAQAVFDALAARPDLLPQIIDQFGFVLAPW